MHQLYETIKYIYMHSDDGKSNGRVELPQQVHISKPIHDDNDDVAHRHQK